MQPSDSSPFGPPAIGSPAADIPAPVAEAPWKRRHPASPIINTIDGGYQLVRFAWPVIIVAALRGPIYFAAGVAAVAVVLGAWMTISHLRFQYRLVGSELEVRSGVLTLQTRSLPVDRVQQVSLNQKLRHQVFGVVEVAIESAGSGDDAEIELSVLTRAEAEQIRARLTVARRQAAVVVPDGQLPPPVVSSEPTLLYRQPVRALFKWSLANSPLLMLLVVAPAFTTVGDTIQSRLSSRLPTGVVGVSISIAVLAGLALAVATVTNVVRYHDMRLQQSGDELRLRYGLLTQHQIDVPRERIQVLVENVTIPGRLAGVVGVTAHNASGTQGGTNTYLPAVPTSDRDRVSSLLAPGVDLSAGIVRHPRAALRRAIVQRVLTSMFVVVPVVVTVRSAWALPVLVFPVCAVVWGARAWRVLGHGETADVVVGRHGVWGEETSFVRRDRVQSVSMSASFFQRRRGLASLRIDVAQPLGRVQIHDMADTDARRMLADLAAGAVGPSAVSLSR